MARDEKSTIVRLSTFVMKGGIRTAFGLLEIAAPGIGARWATRLWFRLPTARRRSDGGASPGTAFTVHVDGRRVVGERRGAGPVVYLVHGWGGRRSQLDPFVEPLVAAGYAVVGFDAPSHGESGPGPSGPGTTTLPEMVDALHAVVERHGPAFGVVGHSAGAPVVATALRDGFAAKRMVFVAPMAHPGPATVYFASMLGFGERIRVRMVERIERRLGRPISYYDVAAVAGEVSTPALLVVHDRDDPETTLSGAAEIAGRWPDARLATTSGLGHRRILRDPTVVAEVAGFLRAS